MLSQSVSAENQDKGVLLLILGSQVYLYDSDRNLLGEKTLRTNPTSGFNEMTAVSHIGPAISYLLALKERGDSSWTTYGYSLLTSIRKVSSTNSLALDEGNWLSALDQPAWEGREAMIRNLVDYGCSYAGTYLNGILEGATFSAETIEKQFLSGTTDTHAIPFNNVMIGTFMLAGMTGAYSFYEMLSAQEIDWSKAKVILRNQAGSNFTAGLTHQKQIGSIICYNKLLRVNYQRIV